MRVKDSIKITWLTSSFNGFHPFRGPESCCLVWKLPASLTVGGTFSCLSAFTIGWLASAAVPRDICECCTKKLSDGFGSLRNEDEFAVSTPNNVDLRLCKEVHVNCRGSLTESTEDSSDDNDYKDAHEIGSRKDEVEGMPKASLINGASSSSTPRKSPKIWKSWADMAVDDELSAKEENEATSNPTNANDTYDGKTFADVVKRKVALSRDQREYIRFTSVQRNKEFVCLERGNGKIVNILEGLELHKGIFSAAEKRRIVEYVGQLQEMGRNRIYFSHRNLIAESTYSAPQKWMRGKGRVTLQFVCCYNYAVDRNGNPPGILKREMVDPLPSLFKVMVKRLVRWHVFPPSCVPDSCIVNIYEGGDCIPPHIDSHDFIRPFCTVSFLSECKIRFGSSLKIVGPGEFSGSCTIPLPVGSVLVLSGNGADVAKHCVPAVPSKRISITFRRMDGSKRPLESIPEPNLQGLQPFSEEAQGSNNNVASRPEYSVRNSTLGKRDRISNSGGPIAGNPGPNRWNRTPQGPRTQRFRADAGS